MASGWADYNLSGLGDKASIDEQYQNVSTNFMQFHTTIELEGNQTRFISFHNCQRQQHQLIKLKPSH